MNLFLLNLAVLKNNASLNNRIEKDVLARLIIIQVQDYNLYLEILDNQDLPFYLSKVYRNEITVSDQTAWATLGDRRDKIRELCSFYHRPASWIDHIFRPEDAFPEADKLRPYFNMFYTFLIITLFSVGIILLILSYSVLSDVPSILFVSLGVIGVAIVLLTMRSSYKNTAPQAEEEEKKDDNGLRCEIDN